MSSQGEDAYVTLLTSDGYLPGAMVLAHSLRDNGTRKKLAAMVTTDSVSATTIEELRTVYDTVIPVDRIRNHAPANLYLMNRPDLDSAFTKIQLWKLLQYRKIVYVDADTVSVRAPDELFNIPEPFSAAPDIGWPDLFNSGVMALTPNMGDYYALSALADRGISFDGADQGLLNMHFTNYNRIGFAYNCTPSGHYQYVPAYRHFQSTISMIHFIGENKPWRVGREFGGSSGVYSELLARWWATYDRHYRAPAAAVMSGQAPPQSRNVQKFVVGEQLLPLGYSSTPAPPTIHIEQHEHMSKVQEAPRITTEEPMVESHANANYAREPQAIAAHPVEERRFSAPFAEWNPAVQPPPVDAKPEAVNFPQQIYSMSADKGLFQPPVAYPEPPKDMWYKVPTRQPPSKPRAIFPWEESQTPPTRVFPDEPLPPTEPEPVRKSTSEPILAHSSPPGGDEYSVSPPAASITSGTSHTPSRSFDEPITPFSPTQVPFSDYRGSNTWDEMPGINRYVSAFQKSRRPGAQSLSLRQAGYSDILSPTGDEFGENQRRSLRITEFPTEIERPSLPVTPAPIRRNMFWGAERDAQGNLPEAEGVPGQNDWNPEQQLEQLRRNSLIFPEDSSKTATELPIRNLPESSRSIITSPQEETAGKVGFSEPSEDVETRLSRIAEPDKPILSNTGASQYFGGDGAGSSASGTVWVDHSTAGQTFERISTEYTPSYTTTQATGSIEAFTNMEEDSKGSSRRLDFDPQPLEETSSQTQQVSSDRTEGSRTECARDCPLHCPG